MKAALFGLVLSLGTLTGPVQEEPAPASTAPSGAKTDKPQQDPAQANQQNPVQFKNLPVKNQNKGIPLFVKPLPVPDLNDEGIQLPQMKAARTEEERAKLGAELKELRSERDEASRSADGMENPNTAEN